MVEEKQTEAALTCLYYALKDQNKTFAEMFASHSYDIRIIKNDPIVKDDIRGENQWILQQEFFSIMETELKLNLSEEDKTGLVRFCGIRHEKTHQIMFEYREIEDLTSAVEDNSESFTHYLKIGSHKLELKKLDAKGFRVLNRLC